MRSFPAQLESMLESKEGWVIERFALSAPSTFLPHMVNLIIGENRVYQRK